MTYPKGNLLNLHIIEFSQNMGTSMKHEGRGVIRMGDKTDHGGQVISASSGTIVMKKEAALANDTTYCPACKGQFSIKPDGKGAKHNGRFYAYHGDLTDCGARLITSLVSGNSDANTMSVGDAGRETEAVVDRSFDDRFVLLNDDTGEPAAFIEYAIERENGNIEHGITNEHGETHWLSATKAPEKIKIFASIHI